MFTSFHLFLSCRDYENKWYNRPDRGKLVIESDFSLMNLLTSKVSKKDLEIQMKNLFRIVWEFKHYISYSTPIGMGLSSTPLNESLLHFTRFSLSSRNNTNFRKFKL